MSSSVLGIDHVAITVDDLSAACAFYDRLFGVETVVEYSPDGQVLVRQICIGGAVLSVQRGNGVSLVATRPTVGAAEVATLGEPICAGRMNRNRFKYD